MWWTKCRYKYSKRLDQELKNHWRLLQEGVYFIAVLNHQMFRKEGNMTAWTWYLFTNKISLPWKLWNLIHYATFHIYVILSYCYGQNNGSSYMIMFLNNLFSDAAAPIKFTKCLYWYYDWLPYFKFSNFFKLNIALKTGEVVHYQHSWVLKNISLQYTNW